MSWRRGRWSCSLGGLRLVGAHQRGATVAAAASPPAREAVKQLFACGLRHLLTAHRQGAEQAEANRQLAAAPALREALQTGVKENLDQNELT